MNVTPELDALRKENFRALLKNYDSKAEFSRLSGLSAAQMSQLTSDNSGRSIGDSAARLIERTANKPKGWLDVSRDTVTEIVNLAEIAADAAIVVSEYLAQTNINPLNLADGVHQRLMREAMELTFLARHTEKPEIEKALRAVLS